VKSYYDPGNSIWKEIDPVGEILHLKHRISQVHIKEVHGKLLGEGKVPLKEVMGALKQIGYDGWLIFETDATDDPPKAQAANLDYLKKLL
jgi:sugar phosphate isomerase/epimerase